jgi:membrane protease YdiL (CAAX protease family)
MKHRAAGIALLLVLLLPAAGAGRLHAAPADQEPLQPDDFWKYPGLSLAVPALGNLLNFVPLAAPDSAGFIPWVIYPSQLLAHLPLYGLNASKALVYSGVELALPAAGVGLMFAAGENDFLQQGSALFLGAYQNMTQFSVYEVYKEFRLRVPPEDPYRWGFSYHSFGQVLTGEFRLENLSRSIVWIPILAGPALLSGYRLLVEGDTSSAVWRTGSGYVGETRVPPAAGFLYVLGRSVAAMSLVGIGEEALFRGVIYEEIKTRTTSRTARIVDMLLFPAVHIPGDIYAGYSTGTVVFQYFWRSGMTLVFDTAYEQGGLPLSAAVHMWSDVLLLLVQWLVYGGVPESESAIGSRLPLPLPMQNPGTPASLPGPVVLRFSIPM